MSDSREEQDFDEMYGTTDFYTTAVLIAHEFELKHIRSEGPGNKVKRFFFEDTQELRDVVMKYMNSQLEGNLRRFRNAIDTVKDMVHSG